MLRKFSYPLSFRKAIEYGICFGIFFFVWHSHVCVDIQVHNNTGDDTEEAENLVGCKVAKDDQTEGGEGEEGANVIEQGVNWSGNSRVSELTHFKRFGRGSIRAHHLMQFNPLVIQGLQITQKGGRRRWFTVRSAEKRQPAIATNADVLACGVPLCWDFVKGSVGLPVDWLLWLAQHKWDGDRCEIRELVSRGQGHQEDQSAHGERKARATNDGKHWEGLKGSERLGKARKGLKRLGKA
jgi:hypothetical protein